MYNYNGEERREEPAGAAPPDTSYTQPVDEPESVSEQIGPQESCVPLSVVEQPSVYSGHTPVYNEPPPVYVEQPPVYTTPPNPAWNMYSPGIYAQQPKPRDSNVENSTSSARRERKLTLGGFLRSACLVIVCAAVSAAAAYLVMDFRIERGDFEQPANQVILGSVRSEPQPDDNSTSPLILSPGSEISAQDIYDMALSQVVGINITQQTTSRFFGTQSAVSSIVGTGFVISADGYVLTNYHVVEMAHVLDMPIDVIFHDGSSYKAEVVGFEESRDVAVLKIDANGLNPVLLGNSDDLRVGQAIYAVGNPFGDLVYTMTDGIVSALDRVVSVEGKTISTFQFSAAVNSGNSGGPVYNSGGEVIGIVTAKINRGNVEGIGFAIPINDALEIATGLIEYGYISGRPLFGVNVRNVSRANADYYDWVVGVGISRVNPGSAAEKAGILVGDIITAIGDAQIETIDELKEALKQYRAGDTADITIWRIGIKETIKTTVTFDEDIYAGRPDKPQTTPDPDDPFKDMPYG